MNKIKSKREREIYNEAIRDALKEVWLYNGVIPDAVDRAYMCRAIQEKLSFKNPPLTPLVLIEDSTVH